MKLKQVSILGNRYFHKFRLANDSIVTVEALKNSFDVALVKDSTFPVFADATYLGSVAKISFDTVTKELSDGEYATQINGFHWAKISGYAVIKINPGFIKKDNLSQAGEVFVVENSEVEL